jgi:hypothetical protein
MYRIYQNIIPHSPIGDEMSELADYERDIASHFGWTLLSPKERGNGLTCKAPDGAMIALRFDWASMDTGNHYLEVECRENRESPWKASGFGIARKKADYWVVVNEHDVYVADVKNIVKMLKKKRGDLDDHVSRRNLDDYEKRMYARGHLVPLEFLEPCCHVICASPVKSPEI